MTKEIFFVTVLIPGLVIAAAIAFRVGFRLGIWSENTACKLVADGTPGGENVALRIEARFDAKQMDRLW